MSLGRSALKDKLNKKWMWQDFLFTHHPISHSIWFLYLYVHIKVICDWFTTIVSETGVKKNFFPRQVKKKPLFTLRGGIKKQFSTLDIKNNVVPDLTEQAVIRR